MSRTDDTPAADVEALLRRVAAAPSLEPSSELFGLSEGTVVADAYRVDARIGTGGMGGVYRATDVALGRPVALKLHRRRPDSDAFDRLMREASVMARMSHPNVLTIYEVGHHADEGSGESRLFIAMEFIDGGSVLDWSHGRQRGWRATLEVFLQAGEGLVAAHAAGVVHRDFKPHNVLIDRGGRVRVADFGLARSGADELDASVASSRSLAALETTRDGAVMGTPAYMAPEQWRGQTGTAGSDQYAFCVSLFEALFGVNPLAEHRTLLEPNDAVPWIPPSGHRVPARVLRVLRRGLQSKPEARFESMEILLSELRRQPGRRWLGAGAVGFAAALSGFAVWGATRTPEVECEAQAVVEQTWNETSRQGVSEALVRSGQPFAETAARNTVALLDAYAEAWVEEDDAACRAEVDEPQVAARRACLRVYRRRFEALVDALPNVDDAGAQRAVTAAASLAELSSCASPSAPEAHEFDDVQEVVETQLDALQVEVALEQRVAAHARVKALRKMGVTALSQRARFELLAAMHAFEHDDSDEALAGFDEALVAALAAADDALLANAAVELSIVLNRRDRPREAKRTFGIALGAAERSDSPVALRLKLKFAESAAHSSDGRHDEALQALESAVLLAESELGEEHPTTVQTLSNLTVPLGKLHRYEEALDVNARAMEIARRVEGDGHPTMSGLLEGRAVMLYGMGRAEEALEPLREAFAIRSALAPTASQTVTTATNLAATLLSIASDRGADEGERGEALALLEPIARQLEAEGRINEPGTAVLWQNLGSILMNQGRVEEGRVLIERGVSNLEANHGRNSLRLGPGLTQLASAELKLGRFNEARAHVKRAHQIALDSNEDAAIVARVELLWGMVERDAGELEEARRLFEVSVDRARRANAETLVERGTKELARLDEKQ